MKKQSQILLLLAVIVAMVSVLAIALPWVVVNAQDVPESTEPARVTDSVEFSSQLKPLEKAGQFAWAGINGQELSTPYSADAVPRQTQTYEGEGTACVFGGGSGDSCLNAEDAASATTTAGTMDPVAEGLSILGLKLTGADAGVSVPFTTGARCYIDSLGKPQGSGDKPTGELVYGTGILLDLITSGDRMNAADLSKKVPKTAQHKYPGVLGLGAFDIHLEMTADWGEDPQTLRAYSEIKVSYYVKRGSTSSTPVTFTARSECGMKMSDGTGSEGPGGVEPAAARAMMLAAPETTTVTSAAGSPQSLGFTTEDTLTGGEADYHLLATRELDMLDGLVIEEILAEVSETGAVEGSHWKLFDAATAGELVPVLEIELHDGAIVQVRPIMGGVVLPSPDLIEPITTVETTTAAVSETPAPESAVSETSTPEIIMTIEPAPTTTSGE